MDITLSPETQQLIVDHMARNGYATADEAIRDVLRGTADDAVPTDELDAETMAALDRSEAESERGETVSWDDLKAELKARTPLS